MNFNQRMIENALSLRKPQKDSLDILVKILEGFELRKDFNLDEALLHMQEFAPSLKDFQRAFPSICFALATGVGKTRLMGAFVSYLHIEKGVKNFFVLAPNLTIYRKLIADFTPNTPKYVFTGISEFAIKPPMIVTGDNYDQIGDLLDSDRDRVKINIFNISKIDSDKDSATGVPRIRKMAEYLGQPYFDYLSNLDDLVMLMDESHRYRAKAGLATLNEIAPVLGLELTATPKTTGSSSTAFKNIAYEYNLSEAINDGFVKIPKIVGRSDFNKEQYPQEKLDELKIKDGLRFHEDTKQALQVYADNYKKPLVKPFMLVVARNIEHAESLNDHFNSDDFQGGKYKGRSIVVHSKKSGTEKDEIVERLLEVENPSEPTEIVVHVDMLKEGWDVNNLYTIVPLKTADSKILVEQSIGRGLRLPYGSRTGQSVIDSLNVISHDKFAEIIKAAQDKQFAFQQTFIDEDTSLGNKKAVNNKSKLEDDLEKAGFFASDNSESAENKPQSLPIYTPQKKKIILEKTQEAIKDLSLTISSSKELLTKENQDRLAEYVEEKLREEIPQAEMQFEREENVKEIVAVITQKYIESNLDIPRVKISYMQKTGYSFSDFDLDLSNFTGYEPIPQHLIIRELIGTKQEKLNASFQDIYEEITDYIVIYLIEHPSINYSTDADLIYKLTNQAIDYIRSYTKDELSLRKILFFHGENISNKIFEQMKANIIPAQFEKVIKVDSGFSTLSTYKILEDSSVESIFFRNPIADKLKIRNYVFEGFQKCLFQKQKFDSGTEQDLSVILEDEEDVIRWFKINDMKAREIFDMRYQGDDDKLHTYCPDFIVETSTCKYMIETKASNQVTDKIVQEKAKVAKEWCEIASKFEQEHAGKTWQYLLIPDNSLVANRSFAKLVSDFRV